MELFGLILDCALDFPGVILVVIIRFSVSASSQEVLTEYDDRLFEKLLQLQ